MLTPVERVLILRNADLLKDVGPRQLLALANLTVDVPMARGEVLYGEEDPADTLYMVVEGRVRLSFEGTASSEVGPGEAFGTWALVDDSRRGHRAACADDGLLLALSRHDFHERAAGDVTLLQEMVRVLARRLRALVSDRPEEARVESEGKPETPDAAAAEPAEPAPESRTGS